MIVHLAQLNPTVGDLRGNTRKILDVIAQQRGKCDLILFPELVLTGYPPLDLLLLPSFMDEVEKYFQEIVAHSKGVCAILGIPRKTAPNTEKRLYNSAAIVMDGKVIGYQDKCLLPTYDVFDERRYFEPGSSSSVWEIAGKRVGITICEDIWQHAELVAETSYKIDPIAALKGQQLDLLVNLSASPFSPLKLQKRIQAVRKAALTLNAPVAYCNQVGGNDSLIFDGYSFYLAADGSLMQLGKGFEVDGFNAPSEAKAKLPQDHLSVLYHALVLGVRDYFQKSGFKKACLGLSGGIDSALTLCIAVEALGKENVLAIVMPSRFSSEHSFEDAKALVDRLGVEWVELPIEGPFQAYLDLLEPYFQGKPYDAAEENLQARIRGMLLMAFSNKHGYIVLSTGNKSEFAMGYSTLYGDMCGGLGVIADLTKTQVYALSQWINREREMIPFSTMTKPPSAELRPNQKDSDSLPDYAIVDAVLQAYIVGHKSAEEIAKQHHLDVELVQDLIVRIHRNEYKRRQAPPPLRVSEKAFTVGRVFPIVQGWR